MNDSRSTEELEVRAIYRDLLDQWNKREAEGMAALFTEDGNNVGFDGSAINGRANIESHLSQIFADHPTAAFVAKVRDVRFLAPNVAVLRGVAGMVPPGQSDINPDANAIQTLVTTRQNGQWRVAVFQNTPAAFHGRPEQREKLTEELREVLRHPQEEEV